MKYIAILLTLLFIAAPAFAGLKEKRALKHFMANKYPEIEKQINAAAGFKITVEVDWGSLSLTDYAHMYEEAWTKVYFTPSLQKSEGAARTTAERVKP